MSSRDRHRRAGRIARAPPRAPARCEGAPEHERTFSDVGRPTHPVEDDPVIASPVRRGAVKPGPPRHSQAAPPASCPQPPGWRHVDFPRVDAMPWDGPDGAITLPRCCGSQTRQDRRCRKSRDCPVAALRTCVASTAARSSAIPSIARRAGSGASGARTAGAATTGRAGATCAGRWRCGAGLCQGCR